MMATFVLLHGAYQGGWIWKPVRERLQAAGHTVFAPTLDGCAERAHALRPGIDTEAHGAEIAELLEFEDLRDVVLVATSSGGMVMAAAAERARDRVSRIVFADALALMDGEKIRDIVTRPSSIETDLALGPSKEDAASRLFADLEPGVRDWAVERLTLHPRNVFYQPVKLPTFWQDQWTASVIYCTEAENPGKPHQKRAADALGASWHEIETGHYPMLSTPDQLVELILQG
jgi:pimeloyl-ACP methyl ester carboxylesterase